ncbi:MAG: hypothetical protein JOY80_03215 [Candidatus Dormibacteraeota bacterium]|nr:hypothetical protein [Candidatus Dormibacteraeota bacterium]
MARLIAATLTLGAGVAAAVANPGHAATPTFAPLHRLPALGSAHIWSIAVSPTTPSTILVGTDSGVYTSRDSGASFTLTARGGRVWVVGFDARTGAEAFAGTDGHGVIASADAGSTWGPSSTGLNNLDVRSLAFGLDGIAAGTDSGVYESSDGHGWHDTGLDGDTVSTLAVAANSPQFTVVAGIDDGNLTPGFLYRSAGGGTWQPLQSGLPAGAVASALTSGPIDQAVPTRPLVLVTSKGVYRSGDSGTTWTPSNGVPATLVATTAAYDPLDPSVVYAGADQGGSTGGDMLRSTDSGMTFAIADTGLPSSTKNVEAIGIGPTNPLTVVVALDPPSGGASLYAMADSSLPAPPQLAPEAPGAPVTTVVSTPHATPSPSRPPSRTSPTPQPATGFAAFAQNAFHWPTPLVFEIILVLLIIYLLVRWRQRYYVEGPP